MEMADAVIRQAFRGPLTAGNVAQAVGVTRRHLDRILRDTRGWTIQAYIETVRLVTAAEHLEDGWKVEAVAVECGFAGPRQFYRAFLRRVGVTPGAYRAAKAAQQMGDAGGVCAPGRPSAKSG